MKKQVCFLLFIVSSIITYAQNTNVFPGLTDAQRKKLLSTKIQMPLPTWLPEGFFVTNIVTKTGKSFKPENKVLTITYKKELHNGSLQFKIDAGFEGLGDLSYEDGETVKSKVGNIYLFYEPFEEDMNGKKVKAVGYIITEWFRINHLAFHVTFLSQDPDRKFDNSKPKITKADVKKILQSMQILK